MRHVFGILFVIDRFSQGSLTERPDREPTEASAALRTAVAELHSRRLHECIKNAWSDRAAPPVVVTTSDILAYRDGFGGRYSVCCLADSVAIFSAARDVTGSMLPDRSTRLHISGLLYGASQSGNALHWWRHVMLKHMQQHLSNDQFYSLQQEGLTLMKNWHSSHNLVLLEALDKLGRDEQLVFYIDGLDAFMVRDMNETVHAYCELQAQAAVESQLVHDDLIDYGMPRPEEPLIFGAEEFCYPWPGYDSDVGPDTQSYNDDFYGLARSSKRSWQVANHRLTGDRICREFARMWRGRRRFLNAGSLAGRAGVMRTFLQAVVNSTMLDAKQFEFDHQSTWFVGLLQHPRLGILDQHQQLFLNLHREELPRLEAAQAPFWHCNGNGKRHYKNILSQLQPRLQHLLRESSCAMVVLDSNITWINPPGVSCFDAM